MPIHAMIEKQGTVGSARGAPRMHLRFEAPGSVDGSQGTVVVIHNLSATGMLIETASDLAIGQRITVALPEVARLRRDYRVAQRDARRLPFRSAVVTRDA